MVIKPVEQPQDSLSDPCAGIIRDQRYADTLQRDMRRQRWRRRVHGVQGWLQQVNDWPRWRQVTTTRQKLSVCIITMNAANRIEPVLRQIRPLADELVIGVDSKTTDNTVEVCQQWADTCFIIENPNATCNGGLEALVRQCTGDWVLRLDDDELPVPELADFKAALMTQTRFTHYKLPRLHLATVSPLTWVDDGYLFPDYQLRLFKNDAGLLRYPPPIGHVGIECDGKRGRLPSLPLIHLNLAINERPRREAKLRRYIDRLNGEWVHPVNETCLLYEDFFYRIRPYHHPNEAWMTQLEAIGQTITDTMQKTDRGVTHA